MPKVIVMNIGTDHTMGQDVAGSSWLTRSVWRNAWFADEGDVILTPVEIPKGLLRYVGETLGFDSRSVSVIARGHVLTDEALLAADLVDELRRRIAGSSEWTMMPCFVTASVAELAALVEADDRGDSRFAAQRGCELLNRKTHFRQLMAGAHLPLAAGSIARTTAMLAKAIERHLPGTGTVIIKRDDAAGGMGNITLTSGAPASLPGSRETRQVSNDLAACAAAVWDELTDQTSHALVVETYYGAAQAFYCEYAIGEHGYAHFLNSGIVRSDSSGDRTREDTLGPGLDIPADLPPFVFAQALSMSAQTAALAGRIGYRGPINIDGIVTHEGDVVITEANARWGGGSVLHSLGQRLLGDCYGDMHVLSSIRGLKAVALADILRTLRERELDFRSERKEGVLVLASDDNLTETMECLVIARSRSRQRETQALLAHALDAAEVRTIMR